MKKLYDYLAYLEFVKLDIPMPYCDEIMVEVWINWECQIMFRIVPGYDIEYLSENELDEFEDTRLTALLTDAYVEHRSNLVVETTFETS